MHRLGANQVHDKESVEKHSLGAKEHGAHKDARLAHFHKRQEVHYPIVSTDRRDGHDL